MSLDFLECFGGVSGSRSFVSTRLLTRVRISNHSCLLTEAAPVQRRASERYVPSLPISLRPRLPQPSDSSQTPYMQNSHMHVNTTIANSSNMNPPHSPLPPIDSTTSPAMLAVIIETLPRYFRSLCPHSLSYCTPCPNPRCTLKRVCRQTYIGPNSKFKNNKRCPRDTCKHVHDRLTCPESARGLHCAFKPFAAENRKDHLGRFVHAGDVGGEEWRIRCVLVGLVGVHELGGYMG